MQDPQLGGSVPTGDTFQAAQPGTSPPPNGYTQQPYPPAGYVQPADAYGQQQYATPGAVAADQGLSDTAAGTLAYVTIIPAIIFLVMAPYNTRPFVKFHAFQCLGLAVAWFAIGMIGVIPILGWIVLAFGSIAMLIVWIMCLVKASQGSYLKLPLISEFASKQSGYPVA